MQFEPEKINILMVDDSPKNLLALESILQGPERNLVRAASGNEALRYLLDHEFAVILLDVYMPGLNGLETAELIRGREKSKDIPIIFLTADSTGATHAAKGYSLGAVDYIMKPVEPDILRSKVAVFVELYKKTWQVKRQAELLHEKNIELENANLQRLTMLIELGQQLAAERDPIHLLEKFCHAARNIVGADFAAVGVLDGDTHTLRHYLTSSKSKSKEKESNIKNNPPPADQGVLGALLSERVPVRLHDVNVNSEEVRFLSAHGPVSSFLGAPIIWASEVYGWIYLTNKLKGDDFNEADERLAATLTAQVAVAYENARLYAESQRHTAELAQEIAERKQAEEERARLLVLEQAARAEAEKANRTKDEFLATISHELRTPLTAILGWARMLRQGIIEEALFARALETIERNAKAQAQLIDDLLDVSRIITGKLRIDVRPLELAPLIEATIDSVRPAADAKSITLQTSLDPLVGFVSGDPDRLQQVFWNLFSNAVKFTPNGGSVTVHLGRANSHVEITVSDTGQGISNDFLPHIFDRFRQADGSTTRAHGGLGLGLAIVRHLVELHGGTVQAKSKGVGQGSNFTVNLPLTSINTGSNKELPKALPSDENNNNGNGLTINSNALHGLKVVVVDDEVDARELVSEVLLRAGAEVKSCDSVAKALDVIKTWNLDLLVSDIGMPEQDGYELIRRVRGLGKNKARIPAIALTAYASVDDRLRALSAGFQTHVAKPVEPVELIAVILSLAGRTHVA